MACVKIFFDHLFFFLVLLGQRCSKKPNGSSFQIDADEIWQDCSSKSIDGVGFSI